MSELSDLFAAKDPDEWRKKLAATLATEATSYQPIGHWTQGAAKMGQAALAAYMMNQGYTDKQDSLRRQVNAERIASGLDPLPESPSSGGFFSGFGKRSDSVPSTPKTTASFSTKPPSAEPPSTEGPSDPDAPLPPRRPVLDRSRFVGEAENNPELLARMAAMVRGEVGPDATVEQKRIQAATALDRATSRNTDAWRELQDTGAYPKTGYYPPQTFQKGTGDLSAFKRDVMDPVLRGTNEGEQRFGFPPTGNASGGVAQSGIARGYYPNHARLGGETYATHRPDNLARLEATRVPQNFSMVSADMQDLPPGAEYTSLPPSGRNQAPQVQQPVQMQNAPVDITQSANRGPTREQMLQRIDLLTRNPTLEGLKEAALIRQRLNTPDTFQHFVLPDGTSGIFNPRTAERQIIGAPAAKPTYGVVSHDRFNIPQYGWIDPNTRTPSGSPAQPSRAGESLITGQDFLKTLEPGYANQLKAIAEGRVASPGGAALKSPQVLKILEDLNQYEPGFDSTVWGARKKTRDEFSAGGPNTPAGTITAGNTAIQHLGQLSDAAEKFSNVEGLSIFNKPINEAKAAYGEYAQDPRYSNFNTIRDKYATEAARFYRGVGLAEADIKREISTLYAAQGPDQIRQAIAKQVELMQSKVESLQNRWKQGMNPANPSSVPDFPVIDDKSKAVTEIINNRAYGKKPEGPKNDSSKMTREELEAAVARKRGMR